MAKTGRPKKEWDTKLFADLIGIGCGAPEICWVFRDPDTGKPANIDTVSRWCKREFGKTFQEFREENGAMALKIQLRQNQLALSKKSAAMAIFLGKNYLGQKDNIQYEDRDSIERLDALLAAMKGKADEVDGEAE